MRVSSSAAVRSASAIRPTVRALTPGQLARAPLATPRQKPRATRSRPWRDLGSRRRPDQPNDWGSRTADDMEESHRCARDDRRCAQRHCEPDGSDAETKRSSPLFRGSTRAFVRAQPRAARGGRFRGLDRAFRARPGGCSGVFASLPSDFVVRVFVSAILIKARNA